MPTISAIQRHIWHSQNQAYSIRTSSDTTCWNDWIYVNRGTTGYTVVDPWSRWTSQITWTTTSTSTGHVRLWHNWVAVPEQAPQPARVNRSFAVQRTEQQWAALRAEQERARAERDLLQAAAREQARKLLYFVLSRSQREQYEREQCFQVVGSHGGIYLIRHGTSGNVHQLVDGQEVAGLCAHPELYVQNREGTWGHLPTEDVLAAQALALMHDESVFQRTANVHWGRAERSHLRAVA